MKQLKKIKRQKKQPKNKKSKVTYQGWLNLTDEAIRERKKKDSLVKYIKRLFSWRKASGNQKKEADTNIEISKLILKKFFEKKVTYQEAHSLAQISLSESQKVQKQEIMPVLIFFLGGLLMFFFSLLFLCLRFPSELTFWQAIKTPESLFWLNSLFIFSVIFGWGIKKRAAFERKVQRLFSLGQASSAYSFAKSPGRSGNFFEAVAYLQTIKLENEKNHPFQQIKNLFKKAN